MAVVCDWLVCLFFLTENRIGVMDYTEQKYKGQTDKKISASITCYNTKAKRGIKPRKNIHAS